MPLCGNCGKPVAASDVICPHCDVLLAAYASPTGSSAPSAYVPSAEPPPTEIPSVDMEVQPPEETEVVTDPAETAEAPISTAPRPLFDTYLTVEEIAKAAEGDHENDVVTITNKKVATKTVEFEMPDYAKPPADAAPIPTIEDADDSVPLITHDTAPPADQSATKRPAKKSKKSDKDSDDHTGGESWLNEATPERPARAKQRPNRHLKQDTPVTATPDVENKPVGETDTYLRRLHKETGYQPSKSAISQPMETSKPTKFDPNRRINAARNRREAKESAASSQSIRMGCMGFYGLVLFILWFAVLFSVVDGNFNGPLILVTIALTYFYRSIYRLIQRIAYS